MEGYSFLCHHRSLILHGKPLREFVQGKAMSFTILKNNTTDNTTNVSKFKEFGRR